MISSAGRTASANAGTIGYTSRLDEYKKAIGRLFPLLPKDTVDAWSISEADILSLGLLLECFPQEVAVLEIGALGGTSAFFFASHPKVTRVISVAPNPTVAEEINDKPELLGAKLDLERLGDLRVLEVARAVLAEFPDENRKVQLHAGAVGTGRIGITGDSPGALESSEAPLSELSGELSGEKSLVAFVDGLHTREGIHADLEAIFDHNPHAIAILDDCRQAWGPFVQSGVVSFMEEAEDEYDFRLLGDLGPGVATSNLGIVYPRADGAEVQKILTDFIELFTERLDPLRLLRREEELIATVNRYKNAANEAATLLERNARLEEDNADQRERNSELVERNSELAERNSELAERNSELVERNSELVERNANLAATLNMEKAQLHAELSDRISQFRERIGHLNDRTSGLEEQVSRLEKLNAGLEKRNLELRQENSQLVIYRSSRRYRIADAVAERLRWVPSAARGARRRSGPE